MTAILKKGERIDQLISQGIQIIQSPDVFSFSLDAVLLSNFPRLPKKGIIVDLCAGNGAVGLFISSKTQAKIIGIELQEKLADMAARSIQLNHLEQKVSIRQMDLKDSTNVIDPDSVDLVVCNPPYFKESALTNKNPNPHLAIARHEIHTTLEEVIETSAKLLKMNGRLALVHRPERFLEILQLMEKNRIAPKIIRFVYPKANKEANTILIEGIKDGKPNGIRFLPPLFVYGGDNQYLPEIREMLYGK